MNETLIKTSGREKNASRDVGEVRARTLRPRVDLVEREREWTLIADMPGARSESIALRTEHGKLMLSAERQALPQPPEDGRWLVRERPSGRYEATFGLGEGIDVAAIDAELKDGVLVVHLPKTGAVQPRKVEVRAG
jgi:HSP20 family protein